MLQNMVNKFLTFFPSGGSSKQLLHYGFGAHSPGNIYEIFLVSNFGKIHQFQINKISKNEF